MGHTNETNNLHLPQFVATDKPTFLGDINGAMLAIDNAYGTISAEATGAASTAQTAATAAASAVETASGAVATAQQAATDATSAAGVANTAAATANNAQSTAVLAKSTADAAAADAAEAKAAAIPGSVSVTADGVKTLSVLLTELADGIDTAKITGKSYINQNGNIFHAEWIDVNAFYFSNCNLNATTYARAIYKAIKTGGNPSLAISANMEASGTTITDISANVPAAATTITLYY